MGNSSSSASASREVPSFERSANDPITQTTYLKKSDNTTNAFQSSNISPTTTRRIVKAVKPTASSTDKSNSPGESLAIPTTTDNESNDNNEKQKKKHNGHHLHTSSSDHNPSVARELELEKLEAQKKERLSTMQENQRARREKRLEERRKKDFTTTTNDDKATAVKEIPSYNPFSKFLSVFSVSSHPEHKRSYEVSQLDEDEAPEVKKARAADEEEDALWSKQSSFGLGIPEDGGRILVAATVAALVALAVGVLWKARRFK